MQNQQTPQVLAQPFCAQGDKNTIPNNATGSNLASLQEGFPAITGLPVSQGGIPPERQDFNGIMNLNSQFYFAFQNGWLPTFSQDVSDAIGGYPQGAVLWYQSSDGLQILQSAVPNNTNNFITNPSVIGTSWIVIGTTSAAIQNYFYTKISNCLTKIQQTIDMSLSGETLTVKSGAVLYDLVGNSTVLEQDKNFQMTYTSKAQCYVIVTKSGTLLLISLQDSNLSVADGKVMYNNQECWLPLGLATRNTEGLSTLDLIFNGIGFIGNTMFALPGIEGLIPDGRAEDGTLNSEVINTTGIVSSEFNIPSYSGSAILYFNADGFLFQEEDYYDDAYNVMTNQSYQGTLQVGRVFISGGQINGFNPSQVAQVYTSSAWIGIQGKPSGNILNLTLGATQTNYYAPSNGWIFLDKTATAAGQYIQYVVYNNGAVVFYEFVRAVQSSTLQLLFPVIKGQQFKIVYDAAGSTNAFKFIFDEGEV